MEHLDYVAKLGAELGTEWPAISKAQRRTEDERRKLEKLLDSDSRPFATADTSIVVFGSLARGEWTSEKSDVDWIFLVDGQANPEHLESSLEIGKVLEENGYKEPGKTGTFGNMSFSHELVHRIGGEYDTNSNITRRILLLLESSVIGKTSEVAYGRVVSQILARYFNEEQRLVDSRDGKYRVPRFLLNDVVRFWRTMAVDFASKQRERQGKEWGLRNTKLRFSRKLIFAAGLLMCFSHRDVSPVPIGMEDEDHTHFPLQNHILNEFVPFSPLEILARDFIRYERLDCARKVFTLYNDFLAIVGNKNQREELKKLKAEDANSSLLFGKVRDAGRGFGEGLEDFFFNTPKLCDYIRKYGVF